MVATILTIVGAVASAGAQVIRALSESKAEPGEGQ